jgi:hypothetical protein
MIDNELRREVKLLKATGAIEHYYEIAELLETTEKSFYNWLSGCFSFGEQKQKKLKKVIEELYIPY